MALIYLKNATVEKAFSGGKGYAVSETFKKQDGKEGKQRYKVWFDQPTSLSEGSVVDVSGFHGAKVASFDGDNGPVNYVEVSLNSARLGNSSPADSGDAF